MADYESPDQQRTKQACDTCRRKKQRCPGNRPICSTCQRLGQPCSYDRNVHSGGIRKDQSPSIRVSNASADRIQRLESRIEELYGVIGSISDYLPQSRHSRGSPATPVQVVQPHQSENHDRSNPSPPPVHYDPGERDCPPEDVLIEMLSTYKRDLHHQPLSLFDVNELSTSAILAWPKYLRQSFLALVAPFSSHQFFLDGHQQATTYYAELARRDLLDTMMQGKSDARIFQALCLLIQSDISESKSIPAWMEISMGIRLAISTGFMMKGPVFSSSQAEEQRVLCSWNLFILDRTFGCNLAFPPVLSDERILPQYPTTPVTPPSIASGSPRENGLGDTTQASDIEDLGVTAYCLQLYSIWAKAVSYLKDIRSGRAEAPWMHSSKYHEINADLYEFETKLAQTHRYQKTRFDDRPRDQLQQQREYWSTWLTMQLLFHAIQGLINHPFIHLAGRRSTFQPPSFVQNTVDQAILHAGWILKIIDACDEQDFNITDPFVGHLVAVTATIFLFLLNAKDAGLATQASAGYHHCFGFVLELSKKWKHLRHSVSKLKLLRHGTNTSSHHPVSNSFNPVNPTPPPPPTQSTPRASSSLLWDLLDYSASASSSRPSPPPTIRSEDIELNVTTKFLSPITNNTHAASESRSNANWLYSSSTELPDLRNLFDTEQMAEFTNSNLGRDLWNLGNL